MSKINYFIGLFFVIVVALSSCSKEQGQANLLDIDDDIEIGISQNVDIDGSFPVLAIKTTKPVNCSNAYFDISSVYSDQNKTLAIDLKDLSLYGFCDGYPTVIYHEEPLKRLTRYNLSVSLRSTISNLGYYEKANGTYSITFNEVEGIQLGNKSIIEIPKNTAWMKVSGFTNQEEKDAFKAIADVFEEEGVQMKDGNYGLFTVQQGAAQILNTNENIAGNTGNLIEKAFIVENNQVWESMTNELLTWLSDKAHLRYSLRNGTGAHFFRN